MGPDGYGARQRYVGRTSMVCPFNLPNPATVYYL